MIIGIVIIIIIVIVLEECVETIYKKSVQYRKNNSDMEKFFHVPKKIEIANIGSGPSVYAISYANINKTGFNFGTAPQSYIYGLRLLKHFKKRIKKDAIIITIMCPLSFGTNNAYQKEGYSDRFYGILKPCEIDGYSYKRAFRLRHPFLMKIWRKVWRTKRIYQNQSVGYSEKNNEIDLPNVVQVWQEQFNLRDLKDGTQAKLHIKSFNEKIEIVQQIIELCYNNEWNPVLVIPPIPPSTKKYVSDTFLESFMYCNVRKILNRNKGLMLLDYYNDERFGQNLFENDIFMNQDGQKKFSEILFSDLHV